MNITFSPVIAAKFVSGDFEVEGFKTVLLTQDIVKYYGGVPNSLFPESPVGKPYKSKRTFLLKNIPEAASLEMVQSRIPKTARISETLSHEPIVSDNLQYAIEQGNTTLEAIKARQIVQAINTDTGELTEVQDRKSLKPMYRLTAFNMTEVEDTDLRTYTDAELIAYAERQASKAAQSV
jgi:hypothetical protein